MSLVRVVITEPLSGEKRLLMRTSFMATEGDDVTVDLDSMGLAVPFFIGNELVGFVYQGKIHSAGVVLHMEKTK